MVWKKSQMFSSDLSTSRNLIFSNFCHVLREFIRQNIRYPQAARQSRLEGRVIVQVVIDKDGSVIQPRILRSINPVLSADAAFCEEALRIVSIMPKWKPGSQHGVNVKVRFTFPIGFASPTD